MLTEKRDRRLLDWPSLPAHLQYNKYVIRFYREPCDMKGCVKSLAYSNNELFNIYSHGLMFIAALVYLPQQDYWNHIDTAYYWLLFCDLLACTMPFLASALYHLFMCHHGGAAIYYRLLQFDMIGVWIVNSLGFMTRISTAWYCHTSYIRYGVITVHLIISLMSLQRVVNGSSASRRLVGFIYMFLLRVLNMVFRHSPYSAGCPDVTFYIVMMEVLALGGGVINITRIPERWFPGKFDMFCNSHHIMHVMAMLAVVNMHIATVMELTWISSVSEPCSALHLSGHPPL